MSFADAPIFYPIKKEYKMYEMVLEKEINEEKLLGFGFVKCEKGFAYTKDIPDIQMTARVEISEGKLTTRLTDNFSGEEYVLHRVPSAVGSFVGLVRECHEKLLDDILKNCFDSDVFSEEQSKEIIDYVSTKYKDALEYLWEDDNAIWRRRDNKKWYAALLTVSRSRLGLEGDKKAEIINLKAAPDRVTELLEMSGIFPAYHMNKKHWYTVLLDGTLQTEFVCSLIDESYVCVKKK